MQNGLFVEKLAIFQSSVQIIQKDSIQWVRNGKHFQLDHTNNRNMLLLYIFKFYEINDSMD